MTATITPRQPGQQTRRDGFAPVLRAEQRPDPDRPGVHDHTPGGAGRRGRERQLLVRQPLAGNGSITVRITSLTGLLPSRTNNGAGHASRPRITPAAAFAVPQATPQYPQVTGVYSASSGYFPLAPWAGFAVLCAYAGLALGLAVVLLRRRDA